MQIVQFGVTPLSIETAADILFGKRAEAAWPLTYRPPV